MYPGVIERCIGLGVCFTILTLRMVSCNISLYIHLMAQSKNPVYHLFENVFS